MFYSSFCLHVHKPQRARCAHEHLARAPPRHGRLPSRRVPEAPPCPETLSAALMSPSPDRPVPRAPRVTTRPSAPSTPSPCRRAYPRSPRGRPGRRAPPPPRPPLRVPNPRDNRALWWRQGLQAALLLKPRKNSEVKREFFFTYTPRSVRGRAAADREVAGREITRTNVSTRSRRCPRMRHTHGHLCTTHSRPRPARAHTSAGAGGSAFSCREVEASVSVARSSIGTLKPESGDFKLGGKTQTAAVLGYPLNRDLRRGGQPGSAAPAVCLREKQPSFTRRCLFKA